MIRKIEWSSLAKNSLHNILIYWVEHNSSNKYSWDLLERIEDMADLLSLFPDIGRVSEIPDVRMKLIDNYWLFYSYDDATLNILQLSATHQNPENIYKDIK